MNLDDFSDLIQRPDGGVRRDAEERRERLTVPRERSAAWTSWASG